MSANQPLTELEEKSLVDLLRRVQWPVKSDIFKAIANKLVTTPIELAVLDSDNRVLMFYRKDDEYDGCHLPGTVLRDNENVLTAIKRLLQSEVVGGKVTPPISLGWVEITKGNGSGQNPTRHEISLLHVCWLTDPYQGKGGEFFPIDQLPKNTLPHHRILLNEIMVRLGKNGH